MSLPPEDVLAHATKSPDTTAIELAVLPLTDELKAAIAELELRPLAEATPEYRADIARLRALLADIAANAATMRDAIDNAFRLAARSVGADQLVTSEGVVELEYPRGEWKVDAPALERAFRKLVADGLLSEAEIAETFSTVVQTKADNRRLNYLEKHRGDAVAEAIKAHRRYIEPSMFSGKVHYREAER